MSDTFGSAFLDVHADVTPFLREIEELRARIAAASATLPVLPGPNGGNGGGGSAASAAARAEAEIRRALDEADAVSARARQVAEDEARKAADRSLRDETAAVKAASDEQTAAYRRIRKSIDDNSQSTDSLKGKIQSASSTLSQLGFTGQARMIALAGSIGFPVVALAAFVAAAGAAAAAITVFGLKSADDLRTATLNFQQAGLSAQQAAVQVQSLVDLSAKGLTFANLNSDTQALIQLGVKAKDTTPILQALADSFAASGDVGAKLQTDVDTAVAALATLSQRASIPLKNFATAVKNSLVGASATDVFKELQKELNVTGKQLDDLFNKGKITGAQVASAAVNAAAAGSKGALSNAVAQSPTQAVTALKDSLSGALGQAFLSAQPAIAGAINGVSKQLNAIVKPFADEVAKDLPGIINTLASVLPSLGTALVDSFKLIGPILKDIAPIISGLSNAIIGFFNQANTKGSDTQRFLNGLKDAFEGVAGAIVALRPFVTVVFGALVAAVEILGPALRVVGGVLVEIAHFLQPLADLISKALGNHVVQIVLVIGAALAALPAILFVLAGAFALLTSPVTIVIALAAAVVYAYEHFQTFRTIVQDVFKVIVTVVGTAVKFLIDTQLTYVKVVLEGFKFILEGLSHLPSWLGGGLFSDAAGAVQSLINGIDSVKGAIDNTIDAAIKAANAIGSVSGKTVTVNTAPGINALNGLTDAALNSFAAVLAALQAVDSASSNLSKVTTSSTQNRTSFAGTTGANVKIPQPVAIKFPTPGGGGAAAAGGGAAKALATAAATFKTALDAFVTAIGGAQTVAAVDSAFASLQSAIDAEDKALGKTEPKGLVTYLTKQKAILTKAAQELQLAIQERASFLSQADVSVPNPTIAGAAGILSGLRGDLARATEFAADIKKLQKEGLSQAAINQFLAAGPTEPALRAANDLIAAGQAAITGVGGVNDLQTKIAAQGESLGATLGANFQDAGAQAAKGLIDGITSGIPAMEKAMSAVAASLVKQIKKDLKISSPSRVMFEHGANTTLGFVEGVKSLIPAAQSAMSGLGSLGQAGKLGSAAKYGSAMTNTFHITVNGDLANPEKTAKALGSGIADVLMAHRLSAALAG